MTRDNPMTYFLKSGAIVPIRQKAEAFLAEVRDGLGDAAPAEFIDEAPDKNGFFADVALSLFLNSLGKLMGEKAAEYAVSRAIAKRNSFVAYPWRAD